MEERLQKLMAAAGYGSRRACEEIIRRGRVTVEGQVAELGQKADPGRDVVAVDGNRLVLAKEHVYIALNKPRGVLSAMEDARGRQTVRDLVPIAGHLFEVGRLDSNSEGLMLLTDDGTLAHRLTHPRYEHTKEYNVTVEGEPGQEPLAQWRRGVFLDGQRTAPAEVELLRRERGSALLRVVLREGRKRQIRRVAALLGFPVHRLVRVAIGPLQLGRLEPGEWRRLTNQEVQALRTAAGAGQPKRFERPAERPVDRARPPARGNPPAGEQRTRSPRRPAGAAGKSGGRR